MSLLACLGNDAEPVRDIYLARLQASTEVCLLLSHLLPFHCCTSDTFIDVTVNKEFHWRRLSQLYKNLKF